MDFDDGLDDDMSHTNKPEGSQSRNFLMDLVYIKTW